MNQKGPKLSTEPYKGVRDFYPKEMFEEKYIFDVWRKTCESFGFVEYSASILEPAELYRVKANEEIVSEQTYTFKDRGDREVTLRPEMTPSVARLVAHKRRELSFPLRWYSIPNLFRYERPQKGRLREHYQLNADIFGVASERAEIEIISLAHTLLKSFGLKDEHFTIKINNKATLRSKLAALNFSDDLIKDACVLLDKKNKIDDFEDRWLHLTKVKFDLSYFENNELPAFLSKLKSSGILNVEIDPLLVRGFDYYSGIVFEIFDTNKENRRSLFGGGRYDNLVEQFGGDSIQAVGFGMGDVTMRDVLETYHLLPTYKPATEVYLCIMGEDGVSLASDLAQELRAAGINVAVDLSAKKIGDQIEKASRDGIPFIVVIGTEEMESGKFKLKELATGEEIVVSRPELAPSILKARQS